MASPRLELKRGKKLGEGAYGVVFADAKKEYAVKCHWVEADMTGICSLREMDIARRLRHPSIIQMVDTPLSAPFSLVSHKPPKDYRYDEVYFVMELGSSSLYDVYKEKQTSYQLKKWAMEALLGLEYAHHQKVIHRDIKIENMILVKNSIKLTDFGLSKTFCRQERQTPRLVTSWYRPPEICLDESYDYKADIWSMGCVFYEMMYRKTLFSPSGQSQSSILKEILKKIPVEEEIPEKYKSMKEHKSWDEWWTGMPSVFEDDSKWRDLFKEMMRWDASKRFSASQCLDHPFFDTYRTHIDQMRAKYLQKEAPVYTFPTEYSSYTERKAIVERVNQIVERQEKAKTKFLKPRTLFFAIDLFEQSIPLWKDDESAKHPVFYFDCCVYISYKYFLLMEPTQSIEQVLDKTISHSDFLTFERDLLEYMECSLYSLGMIEVADEKGHTLSVEQMKELLKVRLHLSKYPRDARDLYELYLRK